MRANRPSLDGHSSLAGLSWVAGATIAVFVLLTSAITPARAADLPPADRLRALEQEADQSRARAAELASRTAKLKADLAAQRQELTRSAADVRRGEETLSRLEAEQGDLSRRFTAESQSLAVERGHLARLTAGLVRLTQIPPGGLLALPDAPIDAARGEMLLESALNTARDRARGIRLELASFDTLGQALEAKRREAEIAAATLTARQADLAMLVQKRQSSFQQNERDRKAEEAHAAKIAEQAKDLRDLMARIEAEQRAAAKREAAREAEARRRAHLREAPPARAGRFAGAGLPVAGEIKIRYGESDGLGTTSHGVTIVARPGATVTAPAAGIVRFAGPFRGYRQILILEHPGGYHSLIAGMARIDTALGRSVGAGEPVGGMDDRPDMRPELYYELRRNGQFVDPEAVNVPVDVKGKVR